MSGSGAEDSTADWQDEPMTPVAGVIVE
jgi:hypothetical protein